MEQININFADTLLKHERDTDTRRVIIVDFNHLAWKYTRGMKQRLSHAVMINGQQEIIDTTIQALSIKSIFRWSNKGINPTAVCFDSPCGCRKAYFTSKRPSNEQGADYKAGRTGLSSKVLEAINMTANLLCKGGVSCYKANNYEADDLIFACVLKAKEQYPNLPIDIITGDADLLGLVDDQVNVFIVSRRYTWAENRKLEKRGYIQVTPENFQEKVEEMTDYKNLCVPYNSIILAKLLRGDKSDNIPGHPDYKPRIYKQLVEIMQENCEDFAGLFRYDVPQRINYYKGTQTIIPDNELSKVPLENIEIVYKEPKALTNIINVLGKYIEDEDLEHIRYVYNGINLNTAFTGLGNGLDRSPAVIQTPISSFSPVELQKVVAKLGINLPMV